MAEWDPDRLISASEVERWSYCPVSWLIERQGRTGSSIPLMEGIRAHERIGREITRIISREEESRKARTITMAFLSFSAIIIMMAFLLILLTNVGFLKGTLWRIVIIIVSLLLLLISTTIYILNPFSGRKGPMTGFINIIRRMEFSRSTGKFLPVLSYVLGLILLINGVVLLRPLGMPNEIMVSVLTTSLLFLYGVLIVYLVSFIRAKQTGGEKRELRIGMPLVLMLVVSISVLFIIWSDRIDPNGTFGWVFLSLSLVWFMGALVFDIIRMSRKGMNAGGQDRKGSLPVTMMALVASIFMMMAFLARGKHLEDYGMISIIMAGLWLIGAVFFLVKGARYDREAHDAKGAVGLPVNSHVKSADDIGSGIRGKPLTSKKHYLVGSPDIIIEEHGKMIPVEIKTGRAPVKPHFSHVMQLGVYLLLIDVNIHQETPYGYIEYVPPKGNRTRHKVEWDMLLKAMVLSKVSEIREAERTGEAHRNHEREGKCRHCSRRDQCPERLV